MDETVDHDRRMDLVIYLGNMVVPIEVKIWDRDQIRQLDDYYQYFAQIRNQNGTFEICDLTPSGRKPSEISISDSEKKQWLASGEY